MKKKFKLCHPKGIAVIMLAVLSAAVMSACSGGNTAEKSMTDESVKIVFTDSEITSEGASAGFETEGTELTINESGTYILSGSCDNGSVKVKKGTVGVTLVLNGLNLTSADTAAIACNKSTEVSIIASEGTENTLTDSAQNNDEDYPDNLNTENAVIKCKDGSNVTISGTGTININGNGKNGIKSGMTTAEEGEAQLTIKEVTLNITAKDDGINAEQLLNIESGSITVKAGDDGIHCDYTMNIGADGTDGPYIDITECCEGIEAATLNVYSGDININSEDDCMNAANSDLSGYDFQLNIGGGKIYMYSSAGDGIDSNGDITFAGGTVEVWTASRADNQPIDADGNITVSGGTVFGGGGSAGMGALGVASEQGYVTFGSSAFGGGRGGMKEMAEGERPERPEMTEGERPERPEMTEGERPERPEMTEAERPEKSEMPKGENVPGFSADQSLLVDSGNNAAIKDSDGNVLFSGTAPCDIGYVFFSSADVAEGANYSLMNGETEVETAAGVVK